MRGPKNWRRWVIALASVVVLGWLGIGAVGGPIFGKISEVSEIDLVAFLPSSAEATKVNQQLDNFRDKQGMSALIVTEADNERPLTSAQRTSIGFQVKEVVDNASTMSAPAPPIPSQDGRALLLIIELKEGTEPADAVEQLRAHLKENPIEGTSQYVTGPAGFAADLGEAFSGIDGILLLVALAVVFVILIIVYRSPLLPVIVLVTSLLALTASVTIVFTLAKAGVLELNGQVQGILFILVIGAATDYSLLYVSRYREELYVHADRLRATKAAWRGAIEPILASGGTVIVGLLCLLLSDLGSNRALGPVGSIGILMAMAAALTLLPSTLLLVGRSAFWPLAPRATAAQKRHHHQAQVRGLWPRVGRLVAARPRAIWVTTTLILAVAALGVFGLRADGVAQSQLIVGQSEARDGQDALARHFDDGFGSPTFVIASSSSRDDVVTQLEKDPAVASVSVSAEGGAVLPLGEAAKSAAMAASPQLHTMSQTLPQPIEHQGSQLLQVTLRDAPDSDAAREAIPRLRNAAKAADTSAQVGGVTAVQYDTAQASIHDRKVIIPVVLAAITIILMILLRSILAPLLLLATTVISFGTALGVAALLFNHVWDMPGADPSVVLYGFVFLVALGIDYNIFLMTRVREESLKLGTRRGVIKGLVVTGGVITSAGVVLAATFAALAVLPILFLLQLAFIVAFGVLLDTIVVRSLLVPALMYDIGAPAWWPSRLKK